MESAAKQKKLRQALNVRLWKLEQNTSGQQSLRAMEI
jgi:hypothetical protein